MNFLEDDILHIKENFEPLKTSYTQSSGDAGAPTQEEKGEQLSDAGENTRDHNSNQEYQVKLMKFIYTKDIDIKNKLVAKGFRLLQTFDNKIFVFENNCSSTFTKDELTKIVYSNTFCMRG